MVALWLVCFVVFAIFARLTGFAFRLVMPLVGSLLGGLLILSIVVFVVQTISAIVLAIVSSIEAIASAVANGDFSIQHLPWPVKLIICAIGAPLIYRSVKGWLDKRYLIKVERGP